MSKIYVCDWCNTEFRDRQDVILLDATHGAARTDSLQETLHVCLECAPDWVASQVPDNAGKPITDGGQPTPHLDADDGLWIPPRFRQFTGQIVFRTPRATIQHFGDDLGPYYGLIDESHFGPQDDIVDPKNPDLAPDQVRIAPQGEPGETFTLDLDVDREIATDGGVATTAPDASPTDERVSVLLKYASELRTTADRLETYAQALQTGEQYPVMAHAAAEHDLDGLPTGDEFAQDWREVGADD